MRTAGALPKDIQACQHIGDDAVQRKCRHRKLLIDQLLSSQRIIISDVIGPARRVAVVPDGRPVTCPAGTRRLLLRAHPLQERLRFPVQLIILKPDRMKKLHGKRRLASIDQLVRPTIPVADECTSSTTSYLPKMGITPGGQYHLKRRRAQR